MHNNLAHFSPTVRPPQSQQCTAQSECPMSTSLLPVYNYPTKPKHLWQRAGYRMSLSPSKYTLILRLNIECRLQRLLPTRTQSSLTFLLPQRHKISPFNFAPACSEITSTPLTNLCFSSSQVSITIFYSLRIGGFRADCFSIKSSFL